MVRQSITTIPTLGGDTAMGEQSSTEVPYAARPKRFFLLVIFTITTSLTCSYFLNGNGVRAMWRRAGVPCGQKRGEVNPSSVHTSLITSAASGESNSDIHERVPGKEESYGGNEEKKARLFFSGGEGAEKKMHSKRVDNSVLYGQRLPQDSCRNEETKMNNWLKLFQSAELLAFYSGFYLDILGPKLTHCTGQLALVGAVALLAKGYVEAGMIISGLTTQLILNSVMCISSLFPKSQNLVMAILSSACDLAQFLFPLAYFIGSYWPRLDYYLFLNLLEGFSVVAAVVSLLFLPLRPFAAEDNFKDDSRSPMTNETFDEKLDHFQEDVVAVGGSPYWRMPLWRQLLNSQFLVFTLFWAQLILRMNLYLDSNEAIIRNHGDDGTMAGIFGFIIPCSFVSCVFLGVVADKVGVLYTAALVNLAATMVNVISLFPFLHLQWVAILIFTLYKSYLFTLLYAFVAETFGFSNFGVLTVLCAFVGGVTNLKGGGYFLDFATYMEQNWFYPNVVQMMLGFFGQILVIFLIKTSPVKREFIQQLEETLHRERFTHVCGFTGSAKECVSHFVLEGERDLERLEGLRSPKSMPNAGRHSDTPSPQDGDCYFKLPPNDETGRKPLSQFP